MLNKNKLYKILNLQISEHLPEIAKNKVGSYPLQAIIDCIITEEEQRIVVNSLKEKTFELCLVIIF